MKKDEYAICDECGSEFFRLSSNMTALCPECAHVLYGCPNCSHFFKNGRCIYCYWDGSRSEYIKGLKGSYTKKQTTIIAEQDISEQKLKDVVAKAGYDVVSVSREPYEKNGLFSAFKR